MRLGEAGIVTVKVTVSSSLLAPGAFKLGGKKKHNDKWEVTKFAKTLIFETKLHTINYTREVTTPITSRVGLTRREREGGRCYIGWYTAFKVVEF